MFANSVNLRKLCGVRTPKGRIIERPNSEWPNYRNKFNTEMENTVRLSH